MGVLAFKSDCSLVSGIRHQPVFASGAKHGKLVGFGAVNQGLAGGKLHAEIALAVVNGFHVDQGGQLAHGLVALVQQGVGIVHPVDCLGRDLPVELGYCLRKLVHALHVMGDGDVHVRLDGLDGVHAGGKHVGKAVRKGNQAFAVGRGIGAQGQILPGVEKSCSARS